MQGRTHWHEYTHIRTNILSYSNFGWFCLEQTTPEQEKTSAAAYDSCLDWNSNKIGHCHLHCIYRTRSLTHSLTVSTARYLCVDFLFQPHWASCVTLSRREKNHVSKWKIRNCFKINLREFYSVRFEKKLSMVLKCYWKIFGSSSNNNDKSSSSGEHTRMIVEKMASQLCIHIFLLACKPVS